MCFTKSPSLCTGCATACSTTHASFFWVPPILSLYFSPTTPHPLLPCPFLLPSQNHRSAFHASLFLEASHRNFHYSFCSHMISFLVVLFVGVLLNVADVLQRVRHSRVLPRMCCLLYSSDPVSVCFSPLRSTRLGAFISYRYCLVTRANVSVLFSLRVCFDVLSHF